jgi:Lycopene cyclase
VFTSSLEDVMDIQYAYLGYSLIFLLVWIVLYILRPDLRRRMLLFSLIITPLGPLSEFWFLRDYWGRPTITGTPAGIEDAIFAFAIGGIAYGIYKVFFKMSLPEGQEGPRRGWLVAAFFVIILIPLLLLTDLLGVNSIFSSTLSLFLIAVLIWILRPDLLKPSLVSGLLVVILFFLVYKAMQVIFPGAIEYWCMGCNPTGLRISGINVEELLWDFCWGLAGSVMVEAITGQRLHSGTEIPALKGKQSR